MAKLPQFTARARRQGRPRLTFDDGSAAAYAQFAEASNDLARRVGTMADAAAGREGAAAGRADALAAAVPSAGLNPLTEAENRAAQRGGQMSTDNGMVSDGAQRVREFFSGLGYSAEASAAIAGHLQQESNFSTTAVGDNGTAFGLSQWRLDRRAALGRFAASRGVAVSDFDTQLAFLAHELNTSEGRAGQALRSATTLDDATAAMMHFFRPAGYTRGNPRGGHGYANRLAYAQAILSQGGGAPAVATAPTRVPLAAPVQLPAAPLDVTVEGEGFRLSGRAGTIRGEAYDRAARSIYLDRLEIDASSELDALAIRHAGNPSELNQAIDRYTAGMRSQLPDEIVAEFDLAVGRRKLTLMRQATTEHTRQLAAQRRAVFEDALVTRQNQLARIAMGSGLDGAADAAVQGELASFDAFLARQGDDLSPVERQRFARSAREMAASARITGAFDALDTFEDQAAYLENLRAGWLGGDPGLADLGADAYGRITSQMERAVAAREAERQREASRLSRQSADVINRIEAGFSVPESETSDLQRQAEANGDPLLADDIGYMQQVARWAEAAGVRPVLAVDADIAALRDRIGETGMTPRSQALLGTMEDFRDQMANSLDRDPLAWASRNGLVTVAELDMTSPETVASSLAERAATADAVQAHYGLDRPVYLRPHERDALAQAMISNPDTAASFATSLSRGLGPDGASQVLAQIADDAPGLAHAAGAVVAGGNPNVVRYVAAERALSREDGYQPLAIPPAAEREVITETVGTALSMAPQVQIGLQSVARDVYRQMAREQGVSDDLADPNSDARALYGRALQMAAGQSIGADGRAYGGPVSVNGVMTIAPAGMRADLVEPTWRALNDEALAALPPMVPANGLPITLRQLQRGRLVAVGDGLYRVDLSQPGDVARYVQGENGYWTVDMRQLRRLVSLDPHGGSLPVMP